MCQIGNFQTLVKVPKSKPIIAWRAWDTSCLRSPRSPLSSLFSRSFWTCFTKHSNVCPTKDNKSGFWSYRTRLLLRKTYSKTYWTNVALGKVSLWGTVAVHEDGYRAQRAKILWAEGGGVSRLKWVPRRPGR